MELFQDISNQQQPKQQQQVLKTFERRRRVPAIPEECPTPGSDAASPSNSSSSSSASDSPDPLSPPSTSATEAPCSAAGGLSRRGRCSSVLRGAALPGHRLFSSHGQLTSRSLLLAKMSKARRKAYLAYTQQMAEYFAEVDQFELVVESPTAATDIKARAKLTDARPTPAVWQQLPRHSRAAAAAAAEEAPSDTPAAALQACTPPSAARTRSSLAAEHTQAPDATLLASPCSPAGVEGEAALQAATPATAPPGTAEVKAAGGRPQRRGTQQQQQQQHAQASSAAAAAGRCSAASCASLLSEAPLQQQEVGRGSPGVVHDTQGSAGVSASTLVSSTPLADVAAATEQQQQTPPLQDYAAASRAAASAGSSGPGAGQQAGAVLDWLPSIDSSLAGLSLASCTPAGQDVPFAASAVVGAGAAAVSAAATGASAGLSAASAEGVAGSRQQSQVASPASGTQDRHTPTAQRGGSRSGRAASNRSSLAATTPAMVAAAVQDGSTCSGNDQVSLASTTPAAAQQVQDMQQLMQQMQDMLLAVTPATGHGSSGHMLGSQQQQQQADTCVEGKDGYADEADAVQPAGKQRRGQAAKQQQQERKPGRRNKQAQAAEDAAAVGVAAAAADVLRQQEQQQQLAEQHYQAWLQQQAEAAAATELQELELEATAAAELTPLQQMLKACGQPVCLQDIPQMREFLADVINLRDVVKIGEGTYGEAFKSGQVVLKFVPMEGSNLINGWPQKGAGDLLGEAIIALALTDLGQERDEAGAAHASHTDAFVQTHRVCVCRGPYPAAFIKAWKAWDKRHKSENDPIGGLPDEQLYAVFAMANCGRDLEGYQLTGYEQVRSLMLQTALALAVAEEALAFEHRDLHWGNIMLSPPQDTHVTARLKSCNIRVRAEGARVRLIDFTASRLQTPGGDVVFCDLEAEDGIFDGPKGKPQFETYRRMRKLTGKDWAGSHPGTNVLWLLYLTELLLSSEKPIPGATAAQKRNLREFKKRLGSYSNCSEVMWDELFEGLWASV